MGNFIKSRSWRIPFRFRFAMMCVFSLSFWAANAEPIKETQTDPALIQALHQETYDSLTKSTNMDQLVWLSTMSSRLERRIPNISKAEFDPLLCKKAHFTTGDDLALTCPYLLFFMYFVSSLFILLLQ